MMQTNPNLYREVSCVALGALIGTLIAIPLCSQVSTGPGFLLLPLISIIGALIGFRRRKSAAFFYFCILATIALSWLVFMSSVPPEASQQ